MGRKDKGKEREGKDHIVFEIYTIHITPIATNVKPTNCFLLTMQSSPLSGKVASKRSSNSGNDVAE